MRLWSLVVLVGGVAACGGMSASSEVGRSALPPGFETGPIMVWLPVPDLGVQTESEKRFVDRVEEGGGDAISGADLLPLDGERTVADLRRVAREHGASTILVGTVSSAQLEQGAMKPSAPCVPREPGEGCRQGRNARALPRAVPGTMVVRFALFEVTGESAIWEADVEVQDSSGFRSRPVDLLRAAMEEVAERLRQDGLLTRGP